MNELLNIRELTVNFHVYEGIAPALQDLNLAIRQKETFGLVGETGCGKTLTALVILRLIPAPGKIESGSIMFNANGGNEPIDLLTLSELEMRGLRGSLISMIFQEPSAALNPVFTIGEQITEAILLHRPEEVYQQSADAANERLASATGPLSVLAKPVWLLERRAYRQMAGNPDLAWPRLIGRIPLIRRLLWRIGVEAEKLAVEGLRDVEIPDPGRVVRQYPHQLSGGMKQRAVIAMALACCPRLLIADEPTTSLDVTIEAQILELLRKLKVDTQASILYITHDLAVAAQICDRVGVMYSGTLCEVATAEEMYGNPLHPYTKALLVAVPKPGIEPSPIRGFIPDPLNLPSGCRFHPRCDYAVEVCSKEIPTMREVKPGHLVACHVQ
jgi:peptide/nickel transport system ATP-binding protein